MSLTTVRNTAIVLLLAAAVAFVPGGGTTAAAIGDTFGALLLGVIAFAAAVFYRSRRYDLLLLGDLHRGLLYGATALVVVMLAGRPWLGRTTAGTVVVIAGLLIAAWMFWLVYERVRAHR